MKKILAILFILIVSQICFAQSEAYKIDEFLRLGGGVMVILATPILTLN